MGESTIKGLIYIPVWIQILTELYDGTTIAHQISLNLEVTYSHISNTLKELKKEEYLTMNKQGRSNNLILTDKGEKIGKFFSDLKWPR